MFWETVWFHTEITVPLQADSFVSYPYLPALHRNAYWSRQCIQGCVGCVLIPLRILMTKGIVEWGQFGIQDKQLLSSWAISLPEAWNFRSFNCGSWNPDSFHLWWSCYICTVIRPSSEMPECLWSVCAIIQPGWTLTSKSHDAAPHDLVTNNVKHVLFAMSYCG